MNPDSGGRPGALWLVLVLLLLAALACTSNDTLFIQLTKTLAPTITPTPLTIETLYKVGNKPYIVYWTFQIPMASRPKMHDSQAATLSTCFPNTQIEVRDVSHNVDDPSDQRVYYQIQCAAASGWVPEFWLTMLNPSGSATVKSSDGKGAILFTDPNTQSKPVSDTPCADGTKVSISALSLNPDGADNASDTNVYAQVTCGKDTGYALGSLLVPAD